eukprot:14245971-Heterocapsa_arctica.AAC.1
MSELRNIKGPQGEEQLVQNSEETARAGIPLESEEIQNSAEDMIEQFDESEEDNKLQQESDREEPAHAEHRLD